MSLPIQQIMSGSDALGFEKKLWEAADKLRSNMDAAVYKHVVLGLIFLKYISDAFDELFEALKKDSEADEEDEDEYIAKKIFWVPKEARWTNLKDHARQPEIGQIIDDAMRAIEKRNPKLKGVLPKDYARPTLDKLKLGELVDLIGDIGLGSKDNQSKDILGRVYEYFLGEFASAEGKKGGQFYTPRSIVKLLVEIIRPFKGRIYDPCCGSGGMFVQSDLFLKEHGGRIDNLSIYGQESNDTTWRLFKMNMAIRNMAVNIGEGPADTLLNDIHPDLRADYVLANPPFNLSEWGYSSTINDKRWKFGEPVDSNANFAWVQHIVHHLSPNGVAGIVLGNGAISSQTTGEGNVRKKLIEEDLIECIVKLPNKLFYNTGIPACLWFVNNRKHVKSEGKILMIDASAFGTMISSKQRELSEDEIDRIVNTYLSWKGENEQNYSDVLGFSRCVNISDTVRHSYILNPGRYVGAPAIQYNKEKLAADINESITKLQTLLDVASNNVKSIKSQFGDLDL